VSIQLQDVYKAFGSKQVLRGVRLEVTEGATTVVIGASGGGKSVMLKHIVGLLQPDRGEVWVDGQRVGDLTREELYELRRKAGYVFQFAALFDSMTVAENVGLGLRRIAGMTESQIDSRVAECLDLVELQGYQERYPAQLSGGEKKRAGLARAIATKPKYVLYDEPTTGLDPLTKEVIDRLILRTRDELGVTGVVITHDMASAYSVGDRIAMLHEGRVRFEGTPAEIQVSHDPVVRAFIEGRPELLEHAGVSP
jgi:phospholipid/cholesterol/gamma-HCH transport system ATP-binding protein